MVKSRTPSRIGIITSREQANGIHRELVARHGDALHVLDFPAVTVAVAPEANLRGKQWRAGDAPSQVLDWAVQCLAKAGTLSVRHEPVPSLKWPAMTMEFVPANPSLLDGLKPGSVFDFEFVERKPGEWVITSIAPAAAMPDRK